MANGLFNLKQVNQAIQQSAWTGQKPSVVNYLVVAGGGAGGGGYAGGGGGGGFLTGVTTVTAGSAITVTVGAGGTGNTSQGPNGSNSVFGSITAIGGGGGCSGQGTGSAGGSGGGNGGGSAVNTIGAAVAGQGNVGGTGGSGTGPAPGGGGGAGSVGVAGQGEGPAGNGGMGAASAITGTVTAYAGGGGSGAYMRGGGGQNGRGGAGGGGPGGESGGNNPGTAGTANTGGGGGGASTNGGSTNGGNGGSGIVVISYPDTYAAPTSTTGSPTVSTSGSGSIAGTTATHFYYAGQSAFVLGSGDFTIECWAYFNNFSTYPTVVDFRDSSNSGNGISVYVYNTGVLTLLSNSADRISGATLSTGQWYHIAVTRSGTSTKMFLNGTQTGSTYTDANSYTCGAASPVFMANGAKSSGAVNGSISNVRIVKGTALYTTTFTPSTTPLTLVSGTSLLLNAVSGAFMADTSTNSFIASTSSQVPTWSALSPFTSTGYKNRVYTWTGNGSITF